MQCGIVRDGGISAWSVREVQLHLHIRADECFPSRGAPLLSITACSWMITCHKCSYGLWVMYVAVRMPMIICLPELPR